MHKQQHFNQFRNNILTRFVGEIQRTDEDITGFPSLDNYITLRPGAITIIAGRPRHGKTTMLINLLSNQLHNFPQSRFLYFSYEEARKDIAVKILTLLSGETISAHTRISGIQNYLRGDNSSRNLLEQGGIFYGNIWIRKHADELTPPIMLMNFVQQSGNCWMRNTSLLFLPFTLTIFRK